MTCIAKWTQVPQGHVFRDPHSNKCYSMKHTKTKHPHHKYVTVYWKDLEGHNGAKTYAHCSWLGSLLRGNSK